MPRSTPSEMGLPPFRGAVRQIVLVCVAFYVFILLLAAFAPRVGAAVLEIGALDPGHVRHGWIWQLVTYAFMAGHASRFSVFFVVVFFFFIRLCYIVRCHSGFVFF